MQELTFQTTDGTTLHGWFFEADGAGPHPCVVITHGFSAIKRMGLADYANIFVAGGLSCFVYDHRGYGDSDGMPRHESDPWLQVHDMRDAITFIQGLTNVDHERIGLWGTSYAGGHVLVVSALDRRVKCVVSQVPLTSGSKTLRSWIPASALPKMRERFDADRTGRARGDSPRMITSSREGDETWTWQKTVDPDGHYANETTQRSLELLDEYEPGSFAPRISPTPVLMIVCSHDTQTLVQGQFETFAAALEPKQLLTLDGRHYDAYVKLFDQSSAAARDWLVRHLAPKTQSSS